jgi:hypothetical protein
MHLRTFDKSSVGKMLSHYARNIGPRDHIDKDLPTYNLAPTFDRGIHGRYRDLIKDIELGPRSKPLADFILTLPRDFPMERQREFFEAAYDFLEKEVGKDNVICGAVHLDEPKARPHMHFAFVARIDTPEMTNDKSRPLLWTKADEKKNPEHVAGTQKLDSKGTPRWERVPRLDADGNPIMRHTAVTSKMFNRTRLREIHPALEAYLCQALNMEKVGVVLDDDERKKWSSLDHEDFVKVTSAKAKAEQQTEQAKADAAAAQERLEGVQGRELEAQEKHQELKSRVEQGKGETAEARTRTGELEREVEQAQGNVSRLETRLRRVVSALRRVPAALEMAAQKLPEGFLQAIKSFEDGLKAREPEPETEPEFEQELTLDELMENYSEGDYGDGSYRGSRTGQDLDL